MFDVQKWLDEKITISDSYGNVSDWDRKTRICFLVFANGGFTVTGWGYISSQHGHQVGLYKNEALELINLDGFLTGLYSAGIHWHKYFQPYFNEYLSKIEAVKEQEALK